MRSVIGQLVEFGPAGQSWSVKTFQMAMAEGLQAKMTIGA